MRCWGWGTKDPDLVIRGRSEHTQEAYTRRRHETEFYARQASILLGNNACRSGNDRSPTLKVFFALSRGRRGTQRALNSVSCLLLLLRRESQSPLPGGLSPTSPPPQTVRLNRCKSALPSGPGTR